LKKVKRQRGEGGHAAGFPKKKNEKKRGLDLQPEKLVRERTARTIANIRAVNG